MEDSSTTIYMGMRGDLFEFRISRGGDVITAAKIIALIMRLGTIAPLNSSIRFDSGPQCPRQTPE
jgi:hypothetical protein